MSCVYCVLALRSPAVTCAVRALFPRPSAIIYIAQAFLPCLLHPTLTA